MDETIITKTPDQVRSSRPALTPEARQNQMIAKAINLAEKQLDEGTASSQVITHFLKLGTVQAQLELEKTKQETELIKAKREAVASTEAMKVLYEDAIKAMREYAGYGSSESDDYDGDYDE